MSLPRAVTLLAVASLAALGSALACGNPSTASDGGPPDGSDDGPEAGPGFDGGGEPFLTELSVTPARGSDGATGLTLAPAFYPGIRDYYVRCAAGGNEVTVSMTANPGSMSQLLLPTSSAREPTQTLSVSLAENEAIEAVATRSGASTQYWVRCLPVDFPRLQITVNADAGPATPGYYLLGNTTATPPWYAMIVDGNGVPLWYRSLPNEPGELGAVDVDSLVKGEVSYIGDPTPGTFQLYATLGAAPVSVAPRGYPSDIHDLRLTKDGHYAAISNPTVGGVDLTGLHGGALADGGTEKLGKDATIRDCVVVEYTADGTVLSTWSAFAHFDPVQVTTFADAAFAVVADGGTAYDVFHCNSLDIDPVQGNYLLSGRSMDSIFYVERASGNVLWKMGGNNASRDSVTTFVSIEDRFFRQHDGRLVAGWQPDCHGGTGRISVFDDETGIVGPGGVKPGARGVLYDVIVGGGTASGCHDAPPADARAGEAVLAMKFATREQDELGGSVRTSAEGTVVGWGVNLAFTEAGTFAGPIFSDFDPEGTDRLDLHMPGVEGSYRAVKVPSSWFDLDRMHRTGGGP